MMLEQTLYYFFAFIPFFSFVCNVIQYQFEVEPLTLMVYEYRDVYTEEIMRQNYLSSLSLPEFQDLCTKAKEYALLDDETEGKREPNQQELYKTNPIILHHVSGKKETVLARECPTEPSVYLHTRKSNPLFHIVIAVIDRAYTKFPFNIMEVNVVKYIKAVVEDGPEEIADQNDSEITLTSREQQRLCMSARVFASVDMKPSTVSHMARFEFTYLNETAQPKSLPALLCPTSPPIVLRPLYNLLEISTEVEFLEDFVFHSEIIKSAVELEIGKNSDLKIELERSYFSTMIGANRWKLCVAAYTRLKPSIVVRWSSERSFEKLGIYEIRYPYRKIARYVTLPCSIKNESTMFLRSENSKNEFTAMFYKGNTTPWNLFRPSKMK